MGGGRIGIPMTFVSLGMTFVSLGMTFVSLGMTFVSLGMPSRSLRALFDEGFSSVGSIERAARG
jgi:hypothetical protein